MTAAPLSPEWSALAGLVVAEYCSAIGGDLVALTLFGSVARGRARPDSDLDLYVVTRGLSLGHARLHGMWGRTDASPEYQRPSLRRGPAQAIAEARWGMP